MAPDILSIKTIMSPTLNPLSCLQELDCYSVFDFRICSLLLTMAQAAQALREALWEDKTPPLHNLPPGHTWQYSRAIGGGAQGKAHLWVRLDESRKIVDRIVIKNFVAQSKHAITEDGPKGRIPTEAYISQLLVPDDSKDFYTVPILACQPISGSTGGWRTYSPYYSLGNFETLVEEHTKDAPLPEPFLWFFFYRMAKAAVAMDESLRKDDTGPVVIHNDIKLDNIFLGSPGSLGKDSDFVMYPPAYLGDFGLAFTIRLGEQSFGLPVGAFGWWPPEHHTTQHFRAHPFSYTVRFLQVTSRRYTNIVHRRTYGKSALPFCVQ